jgi:hypothetical protein
MKPAHAARSCSSLTKHEIARPGIGVIAPLSLRWNKPQARHVHRVQAVPPTHGDALACLSVPPEEKLMKAVRIVRVVSMALVVITAALAGCQSMPGDSSASSNSAGSAGSAGGY